MRTLDILLAAAMGTASGVAIQGQCENWQIDSAHSTASFTLSSSSQPDRSYNLAIAKVAGKLKVDTSKPADAVVQFNIYPAGQGRNLLSRDGAFRTTSLTSMPDYTLLSFQSRRAVLASSGKLVVTGELTAVHVRREALDTWSDAYTGPEYAGSVMNRIKGEATFTLEMPPATDGNAEDKSPVDISASGIIERANFPGLWSALRETKWPIVVFDEHCEMPYYIGPGLKDYSGARCTGMPVLVKLHNDGSLSPPAFESLGADVAAPPTGNQIAIQVHLQLTPASSDSSSRPEN
jgi:polyisoprenoid-binding protein YceI